MPFKILLGDPPFVVAVDVPSSTVPIRAERIGGTTEWDGRGIGICASALCQ